ncbi:hypothetical protein I5Q34_09565 [Streptomyces sp. AV19]|uniref:hypothetical protein n=1 Tax=Streptomyces sp. AV19 TaxID=2793068 RepID=UPI0018FE5603|nr:hypothetical protein [Streptomyces sp. AV19]MBH1934532.1 hypothetical protein [Streptomyces sp. AV19]MDG4536944.1 hypothetical protein [Streptomyces sp. AV19]
MLQHGRLSHHELGDEGGHILESAALLLEGPRASVEQLALLELGLPNRVEDLSVATKTHAPLPF